ncbi:MAG TPA: hypothetical protein VFW87_20225 [Pirellulales bacterium]|nr:hypothetical protein [Pirellulales bacterium]
MIDVTCKVDEPFFGDHYSGPQGAIARIGSGQYRHRFGGSSWTLIDQRPLFGGPTLLFVLDLRDPLLAALRGPDLAELPICTYASCGAWAWPQAYRIVPHDMEILLIQKTDPPTDEHYLEFAGPLPEKSLDVIPMTSSDYPTSEELYWQGCDRFLGGTRFIRILGPPLWLYAPAVVRCECRRAMDYVAALGYENTREPSAYIDGGLFLGEGAIYWFFCRHCRVLAVISQPT